MDDTKPEITLDDAANAVGQMENFFKAFRRVSEVVQFLRTAEGRTRELTGAISELEDRLVDAGRNHDAKMAALADELAAERKTVEKARATLKRVEDEAAGKTAEAEAEIKRINAAAAAAKLDADADQAAADTKFTETLAAADEAEARVAKAKEALAAMMAAGG